MLIVCPSCATSYDVEPASLGARGRQVRCVRCRTVWRAELNRAAQLTAAADALGPGASALPPLLPATADAAPISFDAAEQPGSFQDAAQQTDPTPAEVAAEVSAPALHEDAAPPEAETEVNAPPLAPVDLDVEGLPFDGGDTIRDEPAEDIETAAARRARAGRRRLQFPSLSRLQGLILGLLIVDAMLIGWRADVVRLLPQTASLYSAIGMPVNLRGLSLGDLSTAMEMHEGVPILVVHGKIVNVTGAITEVPRLKLIVRDAARREIYSWTVAPSVARLLPYRSTEFSTRLASPPVGSRDVMVRFLNRRDLMAGGG